MNEVYSFLKENIDLSKNQYLVVGVSGGADSMALLHILMDYCRNSKCCIVCVHIHHNLRKESDSEQRFVQKYCEENHLLFETTKFSYQEKFTEKIGREKRYQFFEQILKKYNSSFLFTAHHGDDLIETILMRLVRGATLKATCGIEKKGERDFYTILRPLLFLNKESIYQYVSSNKIPYVEDISNQDSHYTRNRYRKEVLPFLKEENKKVHLKFLDYSEDLSNLLKYVNKIVEKSYSEIVKDVKLNYSLWKSLDSVLQKEVLQQYLFQIYGEDIDKISKSHFQILMNFINNGTVNSSIDFPLNYQVLKDYNVIFFKKLMGVGEYSYELKDSVVLPNNHTVEIISDSDCKSNYVTYLDSSTLCLPLIVRNCRSGDKMEVLNLSGHKKIGDIFTDEKVPSEERKTWPVVTDSRGTIIWLPGLKKTQFDRKKDGIYDIILKYY